MSSDHRTMNVIEITSALGLLLQGYGKYKFKAPQSASRHLQSELDEVAMTLREMTRKVAKTKTPFHIVYILTSRLFNEEDPAHMWTGGVTIVASSANDEGLAERFRRESTWIWNRMKILYVECGFRP